MIYNRPPLFRNNAARLYNTVQYLALLMGIGKAYLVNHSAYCGITKRSDMQIYDAAFTF